MSFPTILRRSLPTWLLLTVPVAVARTGARGRRTRRCRSRGPRSPPASPAARSSPSAASSRTAATRPAPTPTRSPGTRWRRLPDLPRLGRPRRGRERERQRLRRRRLRRRPQPAQDRLRARSGRDLAASAAAARRPRRRGGRDRRRQALRPRRRRRPPRARPRRLRARPEDAPLGAAARPGAARAPRRGRGRHAGLRARRPQRRDRHEHGPLRGLRPARPPLDAAGAVPQARGGTGAAFVERPKIVSVGGEQPAGHDRGRVYAYELRTQRWRRLADLPTPRHGLGVVAHRRPRLRRRRRPGAGPDRQRRGRVASGPRS